MSLDNKNSMLTGNFNEYKSYSLTDLMNRSEIATLAQEHSYHGNA
jgi:hypothetical protein